MLNKPIGLLIAVLLVVTCGALMAQSPSPSTIGIADSPAGQSYYVATDGDDDNPGSLVAPWRTVQRAADSLAPGDTAFVRGGVYGESVTINISGSASDGYINFRNYENEIPILDGSGLFVPNAINGILLIVDQQYITIEGFEIRNYRTSTANIVPVGIHIRGQAHHIQLKNNHIHHIETHALVDANRLGADAHGIAVYGTSAAASLNNISIENNRLHDLILGSSEGVVLNGNVELFTIANNVIYDCDNIAVDIIGFENTAPNPDVDQGRNGIVSGNTIYNISSFGNPAYGDEFSVGGIYVDGGRDITIERNIVYQSDIGIEIASEHRGRATSHVTIRNNYIYHNRITGIAMGGYDSERGSTQSCTIVNNTLYHNDALQSGHGEILLQFDTQNNTIKNNILYANEQGLLIGNGYTANIDNAVDYNMYFAASGAGGIWQWRQVDYQGFAAYQSATGNDVHSSFLDPQLADLSEPNLHLQRTSPAIDAGENLSAAGDFDIDGQPRLQFQTLDIGADEVETGVAADALSGDFDASGTVDFDDFFLFADHFGSGDRRYDLDGSGLVDFDDFFLFADYFGKTTAAKQVFFIRRQ